MLRTILLAIAIIVSSLWVNPSAAAQDRIWKTSTSEEGGESFAALKSYMIGTGDATGSDVSVTALTETVFEKAFTTEVTPIDRRSLEASEPDRYDAMLEILAADFARKNNLRVEDGRVEWSHFRAVGQQNHRRGNGGFALLSKTEIANAYRLTAPAEQSVAAPARQSVNSAALLRAAEARAERAEAEAANAKSIAQAALTETRDLAARVAETDSVADKSFQLSAQAMRTADGNSEQIVSVKRRLDDSDAKFVAIDEGMTAVNAIVTAQRGELDSLLQSTSNLQRLAAEAETKQVATTTALSTLEGKIEAVDGKTLGSNLLFFVGLIALLVLVLIGSFWLKRRKTRVRQPLGEVATVSRRPVVRDRERADAA